MTKASIYAESLARLTTISRKQAESMRPPPNLTVSQHADLKRYLSPESSNEAGKYYVSRAEFQRGIMDAWNDPKVHTIVIRKSAQVGASTIIENFLGYIIDVDPGPCLVAYPEREDAETFAKERFAPMLRDNKYLHGKVKDAKIRDSGNTIFRKKFPGGFINFVWANNPNKLSQRPVRYVFIDDADRVTRAVKNEGDPIRLAIKRAISYGDNAKVVIISTPTEMGRSHIDDWFAQSDQRHYHIPCTKCGAYFVIEWERIKWEKQITPEGGHIHKPETSRIECPHCRALLTNRDRIESISHGEWQAHEKFNGIAGFQISELYSTWSSPESVVRQFLSAKSSEEKLKTWENTVIGKSSKPRGEAPKWEVLAARAGGYSVGKIPTSQCVLTAGVDVQGDRLEYEVVAWGQRNLSWSVQYGVIPYSPRETAAWRELDLLLARQWVLPNNSPIRLAALAIDTGYETQSVYRWCRGKRQVMPVKGRGNVPVALVPPRDVDITYGGDRIAHGLKLWTIGVDVLKTDIYSFLEVPAPTKGEQPKDGFCYFPDGYSDEHFQKLTNEEIRPTQNRYGATRYIWTKLGPNEPLDCRVYSRAAALWVGLERVTPAQWEKMLAPSGTKPKTSSHTASKPRFSAGLGD